MSKFGDFKRVEGSTLYMLQQEADHPQSMKLLEEAGLRPYTYQEILPILMKDEQLRNALKGKWFYLAGAGIDKEGIFTVDEKGELKEIGKEEIPVEQSVCVFSGKNPLSLDVNSDGDAADYGWRFYLVASSKPGGVAPVVVGTAKGREAAAPETGSLTDAVSAELKKVATAREELTKRQDAIYEEHMAFNARENALKRKLSEAKKIEKNIARAKKIVNEATVLTEAIMAFLRRA
jgi:hypothetical protein